MQKIYAKIAGAFKYPDAKAPMKAMREGDGYQFVREPTNPYDPNAIALSVMNDGVPIRCGYVPARIAATLVNAEIESVVEGSTWDEIIITIKEKTAA